MKMKPLRRFDQGFALISSLAILTILVVLIVAYATTMRTERSASQNFLERERAQAIGQAMLSRIMADQAAPEYEKGKRLKPYAVDPNTKLPTTETNAVYNATVPAPGIFSIKPLDDLSTKNHLVRISRPANGEGEPAYTPADWAWERQKVAPSGTGEETDENLFHPQKKDGTPVAPEWIDYYELRPSEDGGTKNIPIGQVAFAIWDESGKVDINLAGDDTNINGVAPHNLGFEKLALTRQPPLDLLSVLNGPDGLRQRSNFSLRRISAKTDENDMGDDRWFFSAEEMIARKLFSGNQILNVTSFSRDFDVRPEWDGDRNYVEAQKYLRSYINNPKLFELFTHPRAGAHLVMDDMDERKLRQRLSQYGFLLPESSEANKVSNENWMQVMRLLVALRTSLPPFRSNIYRPDKVASLSMTQWSDYDVYGIALNIIQATAPAHDQNLFAFDRASYGINPFSDPNVRMGVRVGPYITESAMRITRVSTSQVKIEQFIEFWNPYAFPLNKPQKTSNGQPIPIPYFYGNWTGAQWQPTGDRDSSGAYAMNQRWTLGTASDPNPAPGQFVVKMLPARTVDWSEARTEDFEIRARPYLQNAEYWSELIYSTSSGREESHAYSISIGPFFTDGGGDPKVNLVHFIPRSKINRKDPADATGRTWLPVWHSFQIDDPRMGPFTRYTADHKTQVLNGFQYSWKAYPDKHSLFGIPENARTPEQEKFVSPHGDGYNENFGENWPEGKDKFTLQKALTTFALPRRPFLNVGELGSIFANRPWRTLSFASTITPQDTSLKAGTKTQNYPTVLLDYLTTVGTTSGLRTLNYRNPGSVPPAYGVSFNTSNVKARTQDMRWLFESVDTQGKPNGDLRPIRGRVNLNSASRETLKILLSAPYRIVRSLGISGGKAVDSSDPESDVFVEIKPADADMVAAEIVGDATTKVNSIRPLRSMADLGKLTSIAKLHEKYPDPVVDAVIGRLAQFGTVRQQIYNVDIIARALNPKAEEKRLMNPKLPRVVTAEVRFQARVYFDTFSRKGFVESIEYR